jgi:hypothetical protein
MENLPVYISVVFGLTTILTVAIFYKAANNSKPVLIALLAWLAIQAKIGLSGFYTVTNTVVPRFILLVIPPLLVIISLFITPKGRNFIARLDIKMLTILHTIRIPVEFVLLWLSVNKVVPVLMTFEGRNFDILSGLTAPIIFYFGFIRKRIGKKAMLIWNFICLGLLINIVANAVLSTPYSFQKFAFDQPDIAILYFPFNWLPCCVVPLVLFSHLATIRQLLVKPKEGLSF